MRPLWGLGATYAVHLRLVGKLVGDFLLVIIELFPLGSFVLSQFTHLTDGRTDRQLLITIPGLHSCSAVKTLNIYENDVVFSIAVKHGESFDDRMTTIRSLVI